MRREAGCEISYRCAVHIAGDDALLAQLSAHRDWLASETLATELVLGASAAFPAPDREEEAELEPGILHLSVARPQA